MRETIKSHFEKEEILFKQGIKTLSLFFIDEVANYKGYDENGEIVKGDLWKIFEDEYMLYLNKHLSLFEDDYQRYLKRFSASEVHNGYFSIDKKGRAINSTIARGEDTSNDISAYDLSLKNVPTDLVYEVYPDAAPILKEDGRFWTDYCRYLHNDLDEYREKNILSFAREYNFSEDYAMRLIEKENLGSDDYDY